MKAYKVTTSNCSAPLGSKELRLEVVPAFEIVNNTTFNPTEHTVSRGIGAYAATYGLVSFTRDSIVASCAMIRHPDATLGSMFTGNDKLDFDKLNPVAQQGGREQALKALGIPKHDVTRQFAISNAFCLQMSLIFFCTFPGEKAREVFNSPDNVNKTILAIIRLCNDEGFLEQHGITKDDISLGAHALCLELSKSTVCQNPPTWTLDGLIQIISKVRPPADFHYPILTMSGNTLPDIREKFNQYYRDADPHQLESLLKDELHISPRGDLEFPSIDLEQTVDDISKRLDREPNVTKFFQNEPATRKVHVPRKASMEDSGRAKNEAERAAFEAKLAKVGYSLVTSVDHRVTNNRPNLSDRIHCLTNREQPISPLSDTYIQTIKEYWDAELIEELTTDNFGIALNPDEVFLLDFIIDILENSKGGHLDLDRYHTRLEKEWIISRADLYDLLWSIEERLNIEIITDADREIRNGLNNRITKKFSELALEKKKGDYKYKDARAIELALRADTELAKICRSEPPSGDELTARLRSLKLTDKKLTELRNPQPKKNLE